MQFLETGHRQLDPRKIDGAKPGRRGLAPAEYSATKFHLFSTCWIRSRSFGPAVRLKVAVIWDSSL